MTDRRTRIHLKRSPGGLPLTIPGATTSGPLKRLGVGISSFSNSDAHPNVLPELTPISRLLYYKSESRLSSVLLPGGHRPRGDEDTWSQPIQLLFNEHPYHN